MPKVASIDHNVERGDGEPRDNECVPDRNSPEGRTRAFVGTLGVPGGPDIHPLSRYMMPIVPPATSSEFPLLSCSLGTMPIEQKRVRTDHTSLMGPARCLLYPTRFRWWANEPEVVLRDSLRLWGLKPFTRTGSNV